MHLARDSYQPPPLAPDGLPVLLPPVQRKFDEIKKCEWLLLTTCSASARIIINAACA